MFRLDMIESEKRHLQEMAMKNEEMATNAVSASAWTTAVLVLFLVFYSLGDSLCFTVAVIGSVANGLSYYATVHNAYHRIGLLKQREIAMGDESRGLMRAVEKSAAAAGAAVDRVLRLQMEALQELTTAHGGLKLVDSICLGLICFAGIGLADLCM